MRLPAATSITRWRALRLPAPGSLAGYSALIDALGLQVPVPRRLVGIGEKHTTIESAPWRLLTPRHAPAPTLAGHLTFALKWEGVDLSVLRATFDAVGPRPIEALLAAAPTGGYARRVAFLFEWLTGQRLDVEDAKQGRYVDVVDPALQIGGGGTRVPRFRVVDNLPGPPSFCPMVWRTPTIERYLEADLRAEALEAAARVPRDLVARAAAFLLLKDSRSSYAIEGEKPSPSRAQRWGQAIGQAGREPLTKDELLRLQAIVIGDARFVPLGLREDFGFVGERDRETHAPLPVHIDARPEDLDELLDGLIEYAARAEHLDPVIAAAALAFGFVYIHPFVDGNGRLHRYLIHHVLAERGFHPPGLVFPVSARILERIEDYARVLESYSRRLLEVIEWRPRRDGNVEVLNQTKDHYRSFDATPHAEFLFECVASTIRVDVPREADFLIRFDRWRARVEALVDMPQATLDLLHRFLAQNDGRLSSRARAREFSALTDDECERIERSYAEELGTT